MSPEDMSSKMEGSTISPLLYIQRDKRKSKQTEKATRLAQKERERGDIGNEGGRITTSIRYQFTFSCSRAYPIPYIRVRISSTMIKTIGSIIPAAISHSSSYRDVPQV